MCLRSSIRGCRRLVPSSHTIVDLDHKGASTRIELTLPLYRFLHARIGSAPELIGNRRWVTGVLLRTECARQSTQHVVFVHLRPASVPSALLQGTSTHVTIIHLRYETRAIHRCLWTASLRYARPSLASRWAQHGSYLTNLLCSFKKLPHVTSGRPVTFRRPGSMRTMLSIRRPSPSLRGLTNCDQQQYPIYFPPFRALMPVA